MVFFFRRKKEEAKLPEFPRFPQPQAQSQQQTQEKEIVRMPMPQFPSYEREFEGFEKYESDMKKLETEKQKDESKENIELPSREPSFTRPQPRYAERESISKERDVLPTIMAREQQITPSEFRTQLTRELNREQGFPRPSGKEQVLQISQERKDERPVFVKIEQYREAIQNLDVLKQKLKETESIVSRLEELRAQEQMELSNAQNNLNKIKEKLLEVDKKLFEV